MQQKFLILSRAITDALKFFNCGISNITYRGGFGIMNIMLATVEERVGEIGLRKAFGCKKPSNNPSISLIETVVMVTF